MTTPVSCLKTREGLNAGPHSPLISLDQRIKDLSTGNGALPGGATRTGNDAKMPSVLTNAKNNNAQGEALPLIVVQNGEIDTSAADAALIREMLNKKAIVDMFALAARQQDAFEEAIRSDSYD